ncbi:MAG: right-handed parallel beta-helix repeat-containing protein [Rikenellaceae bacterium]
MKKLLLPICTTLLLSFSIVSCSGSGGQSVPQTITITQSVADDATYELYTHLVDNKDANLTIEFEKGTYHFYPEQALEKYCYMSNHSDWISRIAFPIFDKKGITIDGNGSKFIFHGRMIPFMIENSEDVVIREITVDYAESFHSELTVVENNTAKKYVDFSIPEKYPYEIRNGVLMFTKEYFEHSMDYGFVFDSNRKPAYGIQQMVWVPKTDAHIGYRKVEAAADFNHLSDDFNRYRGKEVSGFVTELKPGLIRLDNFKSDLREGCIIGTKGNNGVNRFAPGIRGENSKNVTVQDFTLHHAAGMGYLFEQCENILLERCKGVPSEGRIVSVTADATHFVGCRGSLTMRDCVFTNQLDDGMNVHGAYQIVTQIIDKHTIGVRMGHYQQLGYVIGRIGDKMGIINKKNSLAPYKELTVKEITRINGHYQRIEFNEELPAEIEVGNAVDNLTAVPDLLVEGCEFKTSRAHGILIGTPLKSVIRNNYFSTQMGAIMVHAGYDEYWCESGDGSNILIENNTFEDCAVAQKLEGIIVFHTSEDTQRAAFENVQILNNTFKQYDNFVLGIGNVDNLLFKGNTITNSGTYPQQHPSEPFATVTRSSNIKFENNTYKGKATKMIENIDQKVAVEFN